jgi:hypothetical protein
VSIKSQECVEKIHWDGQDSPARAKASSEGAPVPGTLEALGNAAHASILWTLRRSRRLNFDSCWAILGALAVGAARAKMFPLAERAMATVACTVQDAIGMEACQLIEPHLFVRVLPAEDATALPAVVATLEQAERFLARGCRAYRGGSICLIGFVSTTGLERFEEQGPKLRPRHGTNTRPASGEASSVGGGKQLWHKGVAEMSTLQPQSR